MATARSSKPRAISSRLPSLRRRDGTRPIPHRRRKASEAGESAYVLAIDVIGPFKEGWDYGRKETAKYAMVATVPVPISDTVEDPGLECGGEGLLQELPEEENQDERDVLDEPEEDPKPANLPEENKEKDTGEQEHQKLEAEKPMKMQLITMVEPLASRQSMDIIQALERIWSSYRFLGIPMYRCHSDRAKEFLSRPVQQWMGRHQLKQTMTCGDNPQSNGRVEAEINQIKRRLRLTVRTAKTPIQEWPTVLRHIGEERQRQQLKQLGLRTLPMVNYNQEVLVKTKVWHKRFTQGMASPYYTAKVKGPSPMMSHGWVVQDKEGKIQHARAVLVPDSRADEVVLEFEAANPGPGHRLTGKQSPDPRLRIPLPVLMSKGAMREPEDEESEPQDQPLPPIGADLSSLQHRETDSHETEDATVSAETGMAQLTHGGSAKRGRRRKLTVTRQLRSRGSRSHNHKWPA